MEKQLVLFSSWARNVTLESASPRVLLASDYLVFMIYSRRAKPPSLFFITGKRKTIFPGGRQ